MKPWINSQGKKSLCSHQASVACFGLTSDIGDASPLYLLGQRWKELMSEKWMTLTPVCTNYASLNRRKGHTITIFTNTKHME